MAAVGNRLKVGKISRKDVSCMKMFKNGYREFDHRGTLNLLSLNQKIRSR